MTNGPIRPPDPPSELHKLQVDYALKWFSYHADQRVKMFNFMLIVFGIFATAVVSAVNYHLPAGFIVILCVVAAVLGLIFPLLDRRNRNLVWLAEEVLTHLEKKAIFGGDGVQIRARSGQPIQFGILSRQSFEDRDRDERPVSELLLAWARGALNIDWRACATDACLGRHRVWLPFVGIMMCVIFSIAAVWIWKHPQ